MILRKSFFSFVQLYVLFLQSIRIRGQFFKDQTINPIQIQELNVFSREIRDTSYMGGQAELPPPEDVEVAQVSENSVHFKWKLGAEAIEKNLDVTVMIYPRDNAHEEMSTIGSRDERIITNLESGKLYTFIIATTKDGAMCNPIVINQDTVPARPTNLEVSTFDFLDIELTFLGQLIPYRIETAGIEAQWKPPTHGECDCYDAYIYPDEGQMIIPADSDGVEERGNVVRQFIHLVPGKEYTISVVSTTCGNGLYGPLTSESVESIQIVPPGRPGELEVTNLTSDEIEVCWNGPTVGHYNQFEITWDSMKAGKLGSHIMEVTPVYAKDNYQSDTGHRFCYTITDELASCVEFDIHVWTAYNDVKSLNPSLVSKWVPPPGPQTFRVDTFSTETISLSWRLPSNHRLVEGYELRLPESEFFNEFNKEKTTIELTNLEPGVMNEIHLLTYCLVAMDDGAGELVKLFSVPDVLRQTTRPMPPMKCDLQCELRDGKVASFDVRSGMKQMYTDFGFYEDGYDYGEAESMPYDPSDPYGENIINYNLNGETADGMTDNEINNIYQAYGINLDAGWKPDSSGRPSSAGGNIGTDDFSLKLTQEIYLNASWLVPQNGKWDGFILDYSPFSKKDFDNIDPSKRPPYFINDGSTMIDLYLPRSDQTYTIYVRAVSNGVESDALIMSVDCGDPKPKGDICMTQKELPAQINMQSNEVKIPLDNLFFADVYNDQPELVELDNGMVVYYKQFNQGNGNGIGKQMVIKNTQEYCRLHPCSTVKLHFHVCTKGYGCQPKVVVGTCPCDNPGDNTNLPHIPNVTRGTNSPYADHINNPIRIMPNACCGTKGYNTEDQICCHDKLYDKPFDEASGKTQDSIMCCGHHKYTVGTQKCCIQPGEDFSATFILKGAREMCGEDMAEAIYM